MEKFEITILGCGAALPTPRHLSSSQIVNVREKLFMFDCAEGVQTALRRSRLKFSHLNAIFLTHLHGDHCFGLIGLLSTLGLLGRTADLHVFGPNNLVNVFQPQIDFFCEESPFRIILHEIDSKQHSVIYEDRSVEISTIPLSHRVPCCGFLIKEKPTLRHIRRDAIDAFGIPVSQINNIKAGLDYTSPDGDVIPNHLLTLPPDPIRSYAYCTDTTFKPSNADLLQGVTALYHEATFSSEQSLLAKKTHHSTAAQAAEIAKLSNAKQLIIGHFSSRYEDENKLLEEAKKVFTNTLLAADGKRIIL
ncbi:MAG: ribonuclease Z [Prevotellaceae bacterium]|nr:ribonuclease Z [Candidatus Minthosoma caballi]